MRKFLMIAAGVVMASALMFGCSGNSQQTQDEPKETETSQHEAAADETVFGSPKHELVKSGSGETLGTVAVFYAPSEECTHGNLDLWYEQYVKGSADNWCVVKYSESPYHGVYALGDMMEIGVKFDGDNMVEDDSEAEMYFVGSEAGE